MLALLGEAQNLPFTVALGVMAALVVMQFFGLGDLLGADSDVDVDVSLEGHVEGVPGHGLDSGLLSLVGLGRVPFMVWLIVLLSAFGVIGIAGQQFLEAFTGAPWSAWLAGPAAGVAALPLTGAIARPLGRLMPQDETSAIDRGVLVGREGEIVIGTAVPGSPARARVTDHFGQVHHVMLEPDNADQKFVEGERVLIVRREGELFKAIARGDHYLPRI
ncbi:YqiJ family protein [Novosphingobium sp. 1949]|uniref:YqiJ family protein n=1 Tax=Novosphingobium organovorum TaxID=2930092 RepID=A0ABT0BJ20_9SPHN|nr:YqiJ family protein [Novosphingobium organovorum]MCJ2185014.1 YqiJ family protein [Novosphingobium organovorum]